MSRYMPTTDNSRDEMLSVIGARSIEELFASIPASLMLPASLNVPGALSEIELVRHMRFLAKKNVDFQETISFLGAGSYRHFIPSVINQLLLRGEFLTAYTPYQPELSQGTLQALYEFQTFVAMLTGMDVANGSLYEGATAVVEAALMAHRVNKKRVVAVSRALHPHYRETLDTYLGNLELDAVELPVAADGTTSYDGLPAADDLCCVIVQYPNFLGVIEDLKAAARGTNESEALLIVANSEPIALGVLKPPGDFGADIVVGEGQGLGVAAQFGGPYLGLFATKQSYVRQMPGRIVGRTVDRDGRDGYVITLATREQHIRRERATSNICTNETLLAIGASVFLSLLGPVELRELAVQNLRLSAYAKEAVASVPGYELAFEGPTFNEFAVRSLDEEPREVLRRLREGGIFGGVALDRWYPELGDCFVTSITEMNTKNDIDRFVAALEGAGGAGGRQKR